MTLSININNGASANGGVGVGLMTSAGNPWSVADALAVDLVNRALATAVNWPASNGQPLTPAQLVAVQALVLGVGITVAAGRVIDRRQARWRGSRGRLLTAWDAAPSSTAGTVARIQNDLPPADGRDGATYALQISYNAGAVSYAHIVINSTPYTPRSIGAWNPPFGVWVKNPGTKTLDFGVRIWNEAVTRSSLMRGSVRPGDWTFLTLSPGSSVIGGWTVGTDNIYLIRVEVLSGGTVGPSGEWAAGDTLIFGPVYADTYGRPLFMFGFDDVPKNVYRPAAWSAAAPVSGRSAYDMLSYYGFRGTVYLTKKVFASSTNGATLADIQALQATGWSIGHHSATHPVDARSAGLRLLGPYGYARSLGAANGFNDCRVVSAAAATDTLTTEGAHWLSINTHLMFIDFAPSGLSVGVDYVVFGASGTTFKLALNESNAANNIAVDITANWTGTAEYRWPGSTNDDSAIYADIVAGRDWLTAQGITGHDAYFALPQGGWDHYVRTAVERTGFIKHTRGTMSPTLTMRTIIGGRPSGGNISNSSPYWPCGWPEQADAISTEQSATIGQFQTYVDSVIAFGAVGANYHHEANLSPDVLDSGLAYLRAKVDAGLIDVVTVDDAARWLGYV